MSFKTLYAKLRERRESERNRPAHPSAGLATLGFGALCFGFGLLAHTAPYPDSLLLAIRDIPALAVAGIVSAGVMTFAGAVVWDQFAYRAWRRQHDSP